MSVRPGVRLRISEDSPHAGDVVTVWSAAPGAGCYWAQLDDGTVVHVRVQEIRGSAAPHVAITSQR